MYLNKVVGLLKSDYESELIEIFLLKRKVFSFILKKKLDKMLFVNNFFL